MAEHNADALSAGFELTTPLVTVSPATYSLSYGSTCRMMGNIIWRRDYNSFSHPQAGGAGIKP